MAVVRADFDDKVLKQNIRDLSDNLRRDIQITVDRRAALATAWLKTNARWTDRTGAARSGLLATAHHNQRFSEIVMAYSVNYGIWLEVAHDRRWAVITPGLRIQGNVLMDDLKYVLNRGATGTPKPTEQLPPVIHKTHKTARAARQAWRNRR